MEKKKTVFEELEQPFVEDFEDDCEDDYDDIREWSGYAKYADICIPDHEWRVKHFIVMKELFDELLAEKRAVGKE